MFPIFLVFTVFIINILVILPVSECAGAQIRVHVFLKLSFDELVQGLM